MTTLTRGAAVSQTETIQQELLRAVSGRGAQTRARGDGASQRRSWLLLRHAAVLTVRAVWEWPRDRHSMVLQQYPLSPGRAADLHNPGSVIGRGGDCVLHSKG